LTHIDVRLYIDLRRYDEETTMLKLLGQTKERAVGFCERCRSVGDPTCRRRTLADGNRERALAHLARPA
jgi:hypothetical protein